MYILELPRLVGTREQVDNTEFAGLNLDNDWNTIVFNSVASISDAAIDQLVCIFDTLGADVKLVGCSDVFYARIMEAVERHDLTAIFTRSSALDAGL